MASAVRRHEGGVAVPAIHVTGEYPVAELRALITHIDDPDVRLIAQEALIANPTEAKTRLEIERHRWITETVVRPVLVIGTERFCDGQTTFVQPGFRRFMAFSALKFQVRLAPCDVDSILFKPGADLSVKDQLLVARRQFVESGGVLMRTIAGGRTSSQRQQ